MADEEDLHKGPLADRIVHKNWKVRRAAFEELHKNFKEATDNAIFEEYTPKFKKIVEDKNAAAQEKGLDALLAWIDRADNPTKLNVLGQTLAVSCFGGRANTVQKAIEALLLFIEVDKSGEAVITALLPECFNKQWKISSTTISTITLALKTFGSKVVPLKPILKDVAKMFEDSNAKVREEAQKLVIEMYRWAGAAIKPTVDTLRPAQVTSLTTAFEALPKTKAVPEKRLRCEQPQDDEEETSGAGGSGRATTGGGGEDEDEEAGGMDAYELAEPVDVLAKIPADWFDKVASPKWKERNEQMDILLGLLNTPRLQPGDHKELTRTLKKIIDKDANVGVVAKAAQSACFLAKGLRQNYAPDAKLLVPTMLAKFKEKKANVVTALHEALESMMGTCFSLSDLAEDLPAAADAKTPPGREQTLIFIARFIAKAKRASVGQAVKMLGPLLLKAMDDSSPEVREASYKAFGVLVGKVGERPLSPYLSKLDGIKEKKVKENYPEKIFTGNLNQPAKPAATNEKPAQAKKPAANGKATSGPSGAKRTAAPAKATVSNQPSKPAAQADSKAETKPAASAQQTEAVTLSKPKPKPVVPSELPLISAEEAIEKAKVLLPETIFPMLEDAGVWKNRLAGMEELLTQLDTLLAKDEALNVQIILRLIEQKPGFKDATFHVMQKEILTVARLAKSQFFTKSMAELVMAMLVEKVADIKLRNVTTEALNGIVEAVGLDFVLREVYRHASENKNPKVANETLGWIGTAIEDFGIQGPPAAVDVKLLVDFIKGSLEHSNSLVRSAATKTLTKVFILVGDSVKEHLSEVKPALMSTIEKEFTKYANAKPDPPTKFYRQREAVPAEEAEPEVAPSAEPERESAVTAPARTSGAAVSEPRKATSPPVVDDGWVEGAVDEYEEETAEPSRADITSLLTPQLFAELSDAKDWKLRKEALDKIRRILNEANMSVQSSCLANLMPKLNARLKDTNKNLVLYTVKLLGILATAVGKDIESQAKTALPLILANYTDQKQTMRDTVTKTLDQWAAQIGVGTIVPFFPAAIVIESSSARKDALAWLVAHKQELGKSTSADLRVLLKPTITALQDKTPDVRHLAEELLEGLFIRVDVESIRAVAKDTKQAPLRQQVIALAKKARASISNSGSTSSSGDGGEKKSAASSSAKGRATPSKGSDKPSPSPATATHSRRSSTAGSARDSKPQPFIPNDDKAKRQRQDENISDEGRGWTFRAPKPEHVQHLQQQAKPYISETLYGCMFSKDFRKHRDALQELSASIEVYVEETKQNVDLLLKWASLRLFDTNTSTQTKTVSFLTRLFEVLDANDYHLNDYEANILLPVLLECMGQGEGMQEGINALLKIMPRVYPSSKFFNFLLNTGLLGSKSPRTRADCLEQIALLIRKQGLTVCANPSVAFPHFVQFVTDRVSAVRNAALSVIKQAHLHIGDDLWLYTGTLNDTQKALINQKMGTDSPMRTPSALQRVVQEEEPKKGRASSPTIKSAKSSSSAPSSNVSLGSSKSASSRTSASANVSRSASAANSRAPSKPPSEDGSVLSSFSLELDKLPLSKQKSSSTRLPALEPTATTTALSAPTPSLPTRVTSRTPVASVSSPTPTGPSPSSAGSNVIIENWIKDLEGREVDKMISACKTILEKLAENNVGHFIGNSDSLVKTLASQLNASLRQKEFSVDKNREFKYLVNVIFKLFSQASIAIGIGRDASKFVLKSLMAAFVDPLVEPRPDAAQGNNLYKGIQLATMKVLRNTDQTAIFTTLLEMLDGLLGGDNASGAGQLPNGFAEVLIKALAIVIQHLKDNIDDINIDQVLFDFNTYLETHSVPSDDTDLKTKIRQESVRLCQAAVKEIVGIKGRAGVCRHLSMVPVAKYPTPAVVRVINRVLKETFGTAGEAITAEDVQTTDSLDQEDEQLAAKMQLKQIMQRLSTTERQQAIKDLYLFKNKNPDIDVQPYLAASSTQFQSYVRRALMAVEEKENVPKPDANSTPATATAGSEDVYMDKLRALQKRYGHAKQTGVSLATDATAAGVKLTAPPSTGTSIQDLRLRLNSMRSGDTSNASNTGATATPGEQAPTVAVSAAPTASTLDSAAAVQQLKARLARIKQAANNA